MKDSKGDTPPATRPDKRRRYAAAYRAMCENSIAEYAAGIGYETPESGTLNRAVLETGRGVPAWRRARIARRIIAELDYWNRTGQ
jgi:hypothetical protein